MKKSDQDLLQYLKKFVTNERKKLFEKKIQERTQHITVVLENVFQGRNISASIRSVDCFGIQNLHIIENDNIFNDDSEVSMGAEKWITTKRFNKHNYNSVEAIKKLKAEGFQVVATTPHNTDCTLYDLDITSQKTALIFGAEVNGCSQETLELADKRMKIPIYGFTESFNISVSVSLCLQHLTYKMRNSNIDWELSDIEKDEVLLQWLRNSIKSSTQIEEDYLKKLKRK